MNLIGTISITHILFLSSLLFTMGAAGIFINRKSIITILMSIELMLLAININFVAFSVALQDYYGQVFTVFVLTVAAAEAAVGLAILVAYFRNNQTISVDSASKMRG
jgi:NADH-quinone oxidoreductase subunit K